MKINMLEIITKIEFENMFLKYAEKNEKIKQDKTIEKTGLNNILLIHSGKYVTLNSLVEYRAKEKNSTMNIEIKNEFMPPLGTNSKIKTILNIPSKMLYLKEVICSPIAFKIPIQIS